MAVNRATRDLLNLQDDEGLVGSRWSDRVDAFGANGAPLSEDQWPSLIALRSKMRVQGVLLRVQIDGRSRWLMADAVPILDEEGEILEVVTSLTETPDPMRAVDELGKQTRNKEALARLVVAVTRGVTLDELLQFATEELAQALAVEFAKVLELLPGGQALFLRAGVGWRTGLVGRAAIGSGPESQAGYTLRTGGPIVVSDFATETRFKGAVLRSHGVRSGASVIIGPPDRPFGVLSVHSSRPRMYDPSDTSLLQAAARMLFTVIGGGARPGGRVDPSAPAGRLSPREVEVLRLVAKGLANREIASELKITYATVRAHVRALLDKLDVHSRLGAVMRAEDLKLLERTHLVSSGRAAPSENSPMA